MFRLTRLPGEADIVHSQAAPGGGLSGYPGDENLPLSDVKEPPQPAEETLYIALNLNELETLS